MPTSMRACMAGLQGSRALERSSLCSPPLQVDSLRVFELQPGSCCCGTVPATVCTPCNIVPQFRWEGPPRAIAAPALLAASPALVRRYAKSLTRLPRLTMPVYGLYLGNLPHNSVCSGWGSPCRILHPRPYSCLLYTSPSPRDRQKSRMPSSA